MASKKAQATMSEPVVICAQPHAKPAKRAKKSKTSTNVESACPSFSRSLLYSDIPKERHTSIDTNEFVLSNSEGSKACVIQKRPKFEETLGHLFGPHDKPQAIKPRRQWELDTHNALFGPDGQMFMSERPRHYDIFELHRNMKMRRRKQQIEDTQGELFGDTPAFSRPASSTSLNVNHDPSFGEDRRSSPNEPTRQKLNIYKYWDVFEPYRGMKQRRHRQRRDAEDTHDNLFGEGAAPTATKPVKNPARFSRKTPKVIEDVVYNHLQPLVFGDQLPAVKTGKACFKATHKPRNPVTGSGFAAPSRDSVVMPERRRVLKAAAEGVTVHDPHDRNPVTGDGMPEPWSIVDPNSRKQKQTYDKTSRLLASQFVIADDLGPADDDPAPAPPVNCSDRKLCKRHDGKRASDAIHRMFNTHTAVVGFSSGRPHDADSDPEQQSTDYKSASAAASDELFGSGCRKRRVQPKHVDAEQQSVVVWGRTLGNVENAGCYIGKQPMLRQAVARDPVSPITGAKLANTEEPAMDGDPDELVDVEARGDSVPPGDPEADNCGYYYYFYDDDDTLDEDEDEVEEGDLAVGRRRSA